MSTTNGVALPGLKLGKILCVRVDNMGDVLMTTPAIRALKEDFGSQINLLASPAGSEVARFVPEVDRVITFDAPWVKTYTAPPTSRSTLAMAERLRAERFDAAVIFTVYSQNPLPAAMLTFLAEIPLRLGYSHQNPYDLLTHWVPDPEPQKFTRHEVRRQLDLVAELGAITEDERLSLRSNPAVQVRVKQMLAARHVDLSQPWLILHPGVSEARRRYSAASYAVAGHRISQYLGCRILVTGVPAETEIVHTVAQGIGPAAVPLAGVFSLEEYINLVDMAPMLITNNTGPVHMAAALNTPVVDVYAATNPQHTPWQTPHRVLTFDVECKACARNICAADHSGPRREVQPQEIVQAAVELWAETDVIRDGCCVLRDQSVSPFLLESQVIGG
ncbi:glycosyl transferase [bacterium]|nr:glycosyl transferase [bacterium]